MISVSTLRYFLIGLLALGLALPALAGRLVGKVVSVADGDTITVLDAENVQHKIRLSGIDAPERGQAFGSRAKEHLADLVAGKNVELEGDKADRYQRRVSKVILNGRDINLAMVASGFAWHYKKYESEQTPADRLLYGAAEDQASDARMGLWRDAQPTAPWDWRARKRERK